MSKRLQNYRVNDKEKISSLEKGFNKFLNDNLLKKDNIKIITNEFIEENIDNLIFKHGPDFVIISNDQKYFIELDGPTHFIDSEETVKDASTIKRDLILQKYCEKNRIIYITISNKKFNLFKKKQFKDFEEFLDKEKIYRQKESKEIKDIKEVKESKEPKESKETKNSNIQLNMNAKAYIRKKEMKEKLEEYTINLQTIKRETDNKENEQLINTNVPNKKKITLLNMENENVQNVTLTNSNINRNTVLNILRNVRPNGYGFINVGIGPDNLISFQYDNNQNNENIDIDRFNTVFFENTHNIRIVNFSEEEQIQNNNIDNDGSYIVNLPNHFVAIRRITRNNQVYFFGIDSLNHENNELRQILLNRYPNARFINLHTDIIQQDINTINDNADVNACAIWAYVNAIALNQINNNVLIDSINSGNIELPNINDEILLNNLMNTDKELDDLIYGGKSKGFR